MPSPMSVTIPTSSLKRGTSNFSIFCRSSSVISWLFIDTVAPCGSCRSCLLRHELRAQLFEAPAHAAVGDAVALPDNDAAHDPGVDAHVYAGLAAGALGHHPGELLTVGGGQLARRDD